MKGNPFTRTVMMTNNERFEQILKAWHYENYTTEYTAEEIRQLRAFDPFWTVASLEKGLERKFLDIDEQCIPWKGRHKCRCYNKSKPLQSIELKQ